MTYICKVCGEVFNKDNGMITEGGLVCPYCDSDDIELFDNESDEE